MKKTCFAGLAAIFGAILSLTQVFTAFAQEPRSSIASSVNGLVMEGGQSAFAEDSDVYIPLRTFASFIGFEVSYDNESKTVSLKKGDESISLSIEDGTVYAQGTEAGSTSLRFIDERVFVSQSFITQFIDKAALLVPTFGYDKEKDETFQSGMKIFTGNSATSKSGVLISSLTCNFDEPAGGEGKTVSSKYAAPQFQGFSDEEFEKSLNKTFADIIHLNEAEILERYSEAKYSADEGDAYSYENDLNFCILETGNLFEIMLEGYTYSGGAHGLESLSSYAVDVLKCKVLSLGDIFKENVDWKATLAAQMNEITKAGGDYWDSVQEIAIDSLLDDARNFYFKDDSLVIYYQPYDIAPYARGFVAFEIPKSSIAPFLADEYAA